MMATARKTHVKTSVELLGDDQEPHHDSSDQSDVDDGSVEGDNGVDDLNGDHSGDAAESDGEDADDEDKGNGDDDGEPEANPNAGWADAMSKILQKKTPTGKSTILLKNKQLEKIKEKEKQEKLEQRQKTDKRRAWEMMCRVKPDVVKDRDFERTFQRTATRGVVQLFNAVRKHQNLVNDKVKEVGGSDRKKAKLLSSVTKKDFIDVLRGKDENRKAAVKNEKETHADGEDEKPSWSVLRDDFMMGASMKDWDKESDGEEGQSKTDKVAEDSDSD